jgi:hypothetical protein
MKILGFDYALTYSSDSSYVGACSADKLQIYIDPAVPKQRKLETILHEVIEAVNVHTNLRLQHRAIVTLATALHQALSENGVNLSPLLREIKCNSSKPTA